ncbi:putative toxin-antitoxin system toxin component, PIN family [Deferrisoma camini]|uniref:putative toxin-antitoxin system toxin component, PIN family n=1 Tax=Deferrisoma camini TaxID=1035120 RepID=UPI00046D7BA3|nr:putative toxin-antitoxin system toxin component, PIN family [Deferrisoma camini]
MGAIVRAGILGRFASLVPTGLLEEIVGCVEGKAYLAERIRTEDMEELLDILREVGEMLPEISKPIPAVVRDPKDDYLVAHAVMAGADHLVTGDRDLLALSRIDDLRIVSPKWFQEHVLTP